MGNNQGQPATPQKPVQAAAPPTPAAAPAATGWVSDSDLVLQEAKKQGLTPALAHAVARQESSFNQNAKSPAGAIGLMQLMPETAAELGVDPYDAQQNVSGGVKYLKDLHAQWDGDIPSTLASYNWGIGNVKRAKEQYGDAWQDHLPDETRNYIERITQNLGWISDQEAAAPPAAAGPQEGFAPAPGVAGFTKALPSEADLNRLSAGGATPRLIETLKKGDVQLPENILHPAGVVEQKPETWGGAAWDTAKNLVSGAVQTAWKGVRGMTIQGQLRNQQEAGEALEQEKQRMADRRAAGYNGLYRTLAPITDLVPIFPANAAQMEDYAKANQPKHIVAAAGAGAAMAAAPYLKKPVSRAVTAVGRQVGNAAMDFIPGVQDVVDRARPPAGRAVTQAVQPGANIPRFEESKNIVGPRIQQLKNDGLLVAVDGQPLQQIKTPGDLWQASKAVKTHVWDHVEDRLGPVDDYLADTTPIAEAMSSGIPDRVRQQYPQIAEAIEKRADTYRGSMSLRGIEEAIEDANNELRDYYKRGSPTDSRIGPHTAASEAEVDAARRLLDQRVEELRGDGLADLKREYGAARDMERAAARAKLLADRQKGLPLYEGLAMLRAAGDLFSGNVLGAAKSGITMAVGRYLTKMRSPEFLIDQAFQGKNAFRPAPAIQRLGPHVPTPVQGAPAILAQNRHLPQTPQAPAGRQLPAPGEPIITPPPADTSGTPPGTTAPPVLRREPPGPQAPPNAAGVKEPVGLRTSAEQGIIVPKSPVLRPEDKLLTGPGGTAEGPGSAPPTEVPPKAAKPRAANGARPVKPMQGRPTPAKTGESPANRPQTSIPAKPMVNGRVTLQGIASMTDREALEQIITDRTKSANMREAAGVRSKQLWAAEQPKPEAAAPAAEPPLEKVKGSNDPEYLKYLSGNGKLSQGIRDAASARIAELEQGRKSLAMKREGLTEASTKARELIKAGKGEEGPGTPVKPMQRQAPVKERYPADLVSYAEGQMKGALDLAQSFERPGRYKDVYSEKGVDEAFNAGRDFNFRGVKSSAHHVAGAFPWYKGEGISLSTLRDAVTKGKGPVYERIMQKVIEDAEPEYKASQAKAPIADVSKPTEPKAEPAGVLPGMAEHVEKQKAGAAKVQGEQMTEELQKPLGSIEGKAGEMERNSPLFRGTDASPQKDMFAGKKKPPTLKR